MQDFQNYLLIKIWKVWGAFCFHPFYQFPTELISVHFYFSINSAVLWSLLVSEQTAS